MWDDLDAACTVENLDKEVVEELGRDGNGSDVGGLHGEKADNLDEEVIASSKEALDQVIELDVRLKVFVSWHLGHSLTDKKTAERAEETHNTERDKGRQPARRLSDDGQSH